MTQVNDGWGSQREKVERVEEFVTQALRDARSANASRGKALEADLGEFENNTLFVRVRPTFCPSGSGGKKLERIRPYAGKTIEDVQFNVTR
ncbi:hypothetical protein ACQU0X_26700 [Pseudovibrio ascidiaceicola]|uniref:hypothetical protein n=1 Tax=Pseudovibrio ascidiaceicola TaxID=285279 RepID=UPI003D35FD9B